MFSLRDRLLLAFANLESHGIAARPSVELGLEAGHAELQASLTSEYPRGTGCYVFWLRSDEGEFSATGELTAEGGLPLHCSGEAVFPAVMAACAGLGVRVEFDHRERRRTLTVRDVAVGRGGSA